MTVMVGLAFAEFAGILVSKRLNMLRSLVGLSLRTLVIKVCEQLRSRGKEIHLWRNNYHLLLGNKPF